VKALAFAYACEPEEGSEPGAGWMWARMLARFGDTWVLTRANNRAVIESARGALPEVEALHFVYVDLPAWARSWKKGSRGLRLYYLLWQAAALRKARELHRAEGFDLVWHLTLANAWLGSLAPLVGPPFLLGPVGGGVGPPWHLVPSMGIRPTVAEATRAVARSAGRYVNPLARLAWSRARVILVQNGETLHWLPRRHHRKARVFPNVVLSRPPDLTPPPGERHRTALFAGRLLWWKGVDLALGAIAQLPDWRLVICGTGPDGGRIQRLAAELGVTDRTVFTGWLPRHDLLQRMREAGVFVFPSLHDDAGWVVVEALAADLPVVCLDRGGPPLLAEGIGISVPVSGSRRTLMSRLAAELEKARTIPTGGARDAAVRYQIDRRVEELASVIGSVAGLSSIRIIHDDAGPSTHDS
jgi:glycosyltransferase involved in cell wall biosynthesis